MADRIEVKLEGGAELLRKLRALGLAAEDALEVAATAGGLVFANAANSLAPEPLIEVATAKKSKTQVTVDVGPPEEKWYWRFTETGAQAHEITGSPLVFEGETGLVVTGKVTHPGLPASPHLRPAFDTRQKQAQDSFGEEIESAIKKVR